MSRRTSEVKPLKTILSALAIAVALLAANTACTSEGADNTVPEQPQQPDTPPTGGITITVGAGINDDGAPSRSIVAIEEGNRALHFTNGDQLYVYGNLSSGYYLVGTLDIDASSISASGKSADFSGTFKVYNASDVDVTATYSFTVPTDPLADCTSATAHLFHKDMKAGIYTIQANHTLVYNIAQAFAADVETLMTTVLKVSGDYDNSNKKFSLGSTDAILNCTLSGLAASTSYKVKLNSDSSPVATYDFSTDAGGDGNVAFVASVGSYERILNILQSDGTTPVGNIDLGTLNFTAKVYNVSRYWLDPNFVKFTDLAKVTSHEAKNGEVLTGVLGGGATNTGNVKIETGATVVLHNVEITSVDPSSGKQYAGIDCEGDATIILSGTNKVKGGASNRPAIYIPKDKTLTLRGSGLLEATGTESGAAIGGGYNYMDHDDCGNIVIEGGRISATAGASSTAAAIGSGYHRSCGTITISGGTVTATSAGTGAAIGSGETGSCGTISISDGTVNANSSNWGAAIGSGNNYATCGTIGINGGTVTATSTGFGAGIGSGKGSSCTGISITGGTVEASGTAGAGIGSGSDSGTSCGPVTITSGVTSVTARKTDATCSIGKGYGASCETVTIGGTVYWNGSAYQNGGDTYLTQSTLTYPSQP